MELEHQHPMTTPATAARPPVPGFVTRLNPLILRLLRLGMPMGPNTLMTVRGRRTGEPRTVPVAILRADDREVVFAAFGEVPWVHNLRAAGRATIGTGRRARAVRAVELTPDVAAPFLEAGLRPVMKVPLMGPMIAGWYGIERGSTTADYEVAARLHPAFELTPDDRT
jgi:deazaflavin-dependent oxidoreductase (nitroreductase family)